jgi:hypothetical protein
VAITPPSALRAATSPFVLRKNREDFYCLLLKSSLFSRSANGEVAGAEGA